MLNPISMNFWSSPFRRYGLRRTAAGMVLLCGLLNGCASLTNPVADGVPVRRVPPEFLGLPREEEKPIPLPLLRQKQPDIYRLGPGDVLGLWIEPILGEPNTAPPIHYSEQGNLPPAIGYPVPVREDGTLALPLIEPLKVAGMSQEEARVAIRNAYLLPKVLIKEDSRVYVSLIKPRTYRVLVVREDAGGITIGSTGNFGSTKRGTGQVLELPAYQNDVLTALTRSGGLPGLEALNEVIIERGSLQSRKDWPAVMPDLARDGGRNLAADGLGAGGEFIRIPLRIRPGEPIPFQPQDIILKNGDIVYIAARDTEVFYTAGIMGSGQFTLPRDYDLDVVEAIALAKGPLVNGGVSANNLSGTNVSSGLGTPSPSLLSIIRRPPGRRGIQIVIRVDLDKALRDPRERILVLPGDILVMQETPGEAIARYFSQQFHFTFAGTFLRQADLVGTSSLNGP